MSHPVRFQIDSGWAEKKGYYIRSYKNFAFIYTTDVF